MSSKTGASIAGSWCGRVLERPTCRLSCPWQSAQLVSSAFFSRGVCTLPNSGRCHLQVAEDMYLEPTTGRIYSVKRCPYLKIDLIWNHRNLWVNMQATVASRLCSA